MKSKLNILGGGGGKRTSPSVKHRSPTLEGVGGEPELLSPMAFSRSGHFNSFLSVLERLFRADTAPFKGRMLLPELRTSTGGSR